LARPEAEEEKDRRRRQGRNSLDRPAREMGMLFVHGFWGALAGVEVNLLATARELKRRGHAVEFSRERIQFNNRL